MAIGNGAYSSSGSGSDNVAVGYLALTSGSGTARSVAIGTQSLTNAGSSSYHNTAVGWQSGLNISSGARNTIIGYYTGLGITSGSYNTIIGAYVTGLSSSLSNYVILADGDGNRRINIPSTGNVLIATTTDSGYKLDVNGTARATQFFLSASNTAPATASSAGTLGEIRITATHIYYCTATNTWVRVAMATW